MKGTWRRLLLALAAAIAASQAGHLLAYQARFGPEAAARQSEAAHAYFPALAAALGSLLGAAVIGGLLFIGAARMLAARRRPHLEQGPSMLDLLALLFTVQVGVFFVQETLEAVLTGSAAMTAPELLLWGAFGQLPAAVLAALAVRWLSVRLDSAAAQVVSAPRELILLGPLTLVEASPWRDAGQPLLAAAPAVFAKRGPPAGS